MTKSDFALMKSTLSRIQEILKGSLGSEHPLWATTGSPTAPPKTDSVLPVSGKPKVYKPRVAGKSPYGQKKVARKKTKVTTPGSAVSNEVKDPYINITR